MQMPPPDWSPLLKGFLELEEVKGAGRIMVFAGVGHEPDTRELIRTLLAEGKQVILPRCLPQNRMEGRRIGCVEDLRRGKFGIPEPGEDCPVVDRDTIDLILTPCLCCDQVGYRLGRGGGYYDRFLAGFSGVTVALCPEDRLQSRLPTDEFDVPVSVVLTEKEIRRGEHTPRRIPLLIK